ncbi:MAG: SH3 domain-containing protein [Rhodobacteraceae bacterium]|nr:SH3 domain-containing protein [Paracoccaceae bacterium]
MTRFFNIVFIVCLAAVFYVRSETPETPVASVQAAKASGGADAELASLGDTETVSSATAEDVERAAQAAVTASGETTVQTAAAVPAPRSKDVRYIMASNPARTPFTVMAASWQPVQAVAGPAVVQSTDTQASTQPVIAAASAESDVQAEKAIETVIVSDPVKPSKAVVTVETEQQGETSASAAPQTEDAAAEVVVETGQTAEPATVKLWSVSGNVVNARSGPGTGNAVLDQLKRGAIVEDTGESDGNWSRVIVQDSGLEVWMHRDFLAEVS